jgi:hypothetical protein
VWPRGWVEVELCSSMTAALEGDEWSAARPGRTLPPGKEPVPILQEAGWAPAPVWTGGKSCPHRDSISDCPARSQSLYRLSYIVTSAKMFVLCLLIRESTSLLSFVLYEMHLSRLYTAVSPICSEGYCHKSVFVQYNICSAVNGN